jgi:hypothetical protein
MKDWLEENPSGSKEAFEQYFKALPADARKVSNRTGRRFPFPLFLTLVCTQIYKDRASSAVGVLASRA